ncbi:DNA repair protein SWI5 homolog isoform X2 [Erpetoichthys calabaricus]|uniref:DNA repair protein SWI5 homolog isoform X2 n=1 Tax=Erpetoichthys calabaricus TaxID=27687 RepID=UPI0022340F0C|nr:DNA repair protein SWI5 homolog isoform X2 [Erpetoichthys calabaricus]
MASPDETRSTTPCRGRSVHLSRGLLKRTPGVVSRNLHNSFKSPVQSTSVQNSPKEDHVKIQDEIKNLQKRGEELNKQITKLELESYSVGELDQHIKQLHEYNDIKDIGQMLLGKLATIRGATTKDLYVEFHLDLED